MKKQTAIITGFGIAAGLALGALGAILLLRRRRSIPPEAEAATPFDIKKYLGRWYEIARVDYRFERRLINVTADYSANEDGSVKVTNRGYDPYKDKWHEAVGKAIFKDADDEGKLLVTFFGPFYSGYNVIKLERNYNYALVFGRNHDYLWLLSRTPTMPEHIKKAFLEIAAEDGYNLSRLVWTNQEAIEYDRSTVVNQEMDLLLKR